ncbi:MAG: hypothetical protein WCK58_18145, partial [Chloroflexota bacterium]
QFRDLDGNTSGVASDDVTLDSTTPSGTLQINGGALSTTSVSVTVALSASDGTASGMAAYRLSSDGTTWSDWTATSGTASVAIDLPAGTGTRTVLAELSDNAGNVSVPASEAIDLDPGVYATDCAVSVNAGAGFTNSRDVVLDIYAPAGITGIEVSNDGGFVGSVWEPYAAHRAWTLADPNGQIVTKVVYVRFKGAPACGFAVLDDIVIDQTAPSAAGGAAPVPIPGQPDAVGQPDGAPVVPDAGPALPVILAATATMNTAATDQAGGSGVSQMQLSTSPTFAGAVWQPYRARTTWPYDAHSKVTVYRRYMDQAGNVSARYALVLAHPATATVPTLTAPGPGTAAQSRRPTFTWAALAGASSYQLQVSRSATFATLVVNAKTAARSYRPAANLAAGTVYWRVRKTGGTWSPVWKVVVPALEAPAVTALATGTVLGTRSPLLAWGAVAGASGYTVQIGPSAGFLVGTETLAVSGTSFQIGPLAANATYVWRVRATAGSTYGPWSATRTLLTPAIEQVVLLAPAVGGTLGAAGILDWADVTGADHYQVQVCAAAACATTVIDRSVAASALQPASLASGTWWWRVRAIGSGSVTGAWSATRSFVR